MAANPEVVALPHPLLDSHLDHCYSSAAVIEAARRLGKTDLRFFFYVVHPAISESHPIGPPESLASLVPTLAQPHGACGVFSQPLSAQQQSLKLLALEAMHDLRPLRFSSTRSATSLAKQWIGRLYELATGFDRNPHCLFRRSVRPNELFLTASFANAEEIIGRFPASAAQSPAAFPPAEAAHRYISPN